MTYAKRQSPLKHFTVNMALLFPGVSRCPICKNVIDEGQEHVATSGSVVSAGHPLWEYQDATIHKPCFLSWPLRQNFIDAFNEYSERYLRGIPVMLEHSS